MTDSLLVHRPAIMRATASYSTTTATLVVVVVVLVMVVLLLLRLLLMELVVLVLFLRHLVLLLLLFRSCCWPRCFDPPLTLSRLLLLCCSFLCTATVCNSFFLSAAPAHALFMHTFGDFVTLRPC